MEGDMKAHRLAFHLGQGVLAGLAGTAAITVSQLIEMAVTGRMPSDSPAQAAQKVVGVQPRDEKAKDKMTQLTHWFYGTSWGMFRVLLGAFGIRGAPATFFHWAAVQQGADLLLPAMKLAPPVEEWDRKQFAVELGHHFAYALAAGSVYDALENSSRGFFRSCVKIIPSALLGASFSLALSPIFLMQAGTKKAAAPDKPDKEEEVTSRSRSEEVAAPAG
jgi:hypothetical protein